MDGCSGPERRLPLIRTWCPNAVQMASILAAAVAGTAICSALLTWKGLSEAFASGGVAERGLWSLPWVRSLLRREEVTASLGTLAAWGKESTAALKAKVRQIKEGVDASLEQHVPSIPRLFPSWTSRLSWQQQPGS